MAHSTCLQSASKKRSWTRTGNAISGEKQSVQQALPVPLPVGGERCSCVIYIGSSESKILRDTSAVLLIQSTLYESLLRARSCGA